VSSEHSQGWHQPWCSHGCRRLRLRSRLHVVWNHVVLVCRRRPQPHYLHIVSRNF
jgi:hypothetical protein